jgi:hypothetical protein
MLAAAGVLAVLLLVVFVVPRLLYPPLPATRFAGVAPDKRIELETNRLKLQNDARATLLQALAGGVLLLGAYFTYRQLRVTREGQITDRYTKAVDQLGSDHLDVRVGGIYALERITRDSPYDRATIEEVLTAYVRDHAPWPPPPVPPSLATITRRLVRFAHRQRSTLQRWTAKATAGQEQQGQPDKKGEEPQGPPADVQAAITVLGRRAPPPGGPFGPLDLSRVDLRRARLVDANLQGARLGDANLEGAEFYRANLQDVWLASADLQGAQLNFANLQGATLILADLRRADLGGADLQDASLIGANLQGTTLIGANLQGAQLNVADLQGARLDDAKLQGARLDGAKLQGARLFLANLHGAIADEDTSWPEGWTRKTAEDRGVEYLDYRR